jgi:hypothetical protein
MTGKGWSPAPFSRRLDRSAEREVERPLFDGKLADDGGEKLV